MLTEQYRPKTWQEVIGQDDTVQKIEKLAKRGLAPRAYWITGQSGTGKTTIARLLAAEIADPLLVQEVDAQGLTVSDCEKIERGLSLKGWSTCAKSGRAVIINEAHSLRQDVIRYLLVALERIPNGAVWIFTTTNEGQQSIFENCVDGSPLVSRCLPLRLARQGLADVFAARALEIAKQEGLHGKPIAAYKRLLQDCRNNFREALQRIEAGEMTE